MHTNPLKCALAAIAALAASCGDSAEAPLVELPVIVDGRFVEPVTTDLGYTVELTRLRAIVGDIEFTTEGEQHASNAVQWLAELLITPAAAHPGHYAGGEIIGELPGRFVVDWLADSTATLGTAILTVSQYNGANFSFLVGATEDGLSANDPLVGATFDLAGTACRSDDCIAFAARIDQEDGRRLVGAPFDFAPERSSRDTLALELRTSDPFESDTLFDGIDFAAADIDGDGAVELSGDSDGANRLRRNLQSHDFYYVEANP